MSGWLPLQLPRPWACFPCRRHLTLQHKADLITSGHNLAFVLLKIELRRPSVCAAEQAYRQPRPIIHQQCRHSLVGGGKGPSLPRKLLGRTATICMVSHLSDRVSIVCLKLHHRTASGWADGHGEGTFDVVLATQPQTYVHHRCTSSAKMLHNGL